MSNVGVVKVPIAPATSATMLTIATTGPRIISRTGGQIRGRLSDIARAYEDEGADGRSHQLCGRIS
jgi:hypothetical protein